MSSGVCIRARILRCSPRMCGRCFLVRMGCGRGGDLRFMWRCFIRCSLRQPVGWGAESGALWSMMLEEFAVLAAAVIPALVLARVERRTWGVYGLPVRTAFGKLFWVGTVWGFAGITLLLGAMYGLRVFDVGHLAIHGGRIVKFAVFWAVFFLLVGLFEEFLLRGYSQFTLTRAIGFWPAAVLLSCTFGLVHMSNGGRAVAGIAGGGGDRILLLLDAAAHGDVVVRGGISCGVGLGRDIFLFGAG